MSPAKRAGLGLALTGVLSLSACGAGNVNLDPAPDAANPVCAYAMVAMPEKLVGLQQRETTAQGTTAWGEPASVILKCGVTVQEPVSDPCAEVNGIDWVLRPKDAPENSAPPVSASSSAAAGPENRATGTWTATTYGRTPSTQIRFHHQLFLLSSTRRSNKFRLRRNARTSTILSTVSKPENRGFKTSGSLPSVHFTQTQILEPSRP